jgi:hypoxanthine phosphoribosyltransferase
MQKEYIICEEISKNIMRKNILLIDEQLDTCNTVKNAINYLYNSKNAFFCVTMYYLF